MSVGVTNVKKLNIVLVIAVDITAFYPIFTLLPMSFPSSSNKVIPSFISLFLMNKQLMKPADPDAQKLMKKVIKTALLPMNFELNGSITFLSPSPSPIELEHANRYD